MSEIFSVEPDGTVKTFHYHEDTGDAVIKSIHDPSAVVDHCKALANDGLTDKGIKQGFWRVAAIPMWVVVEMKKKGVNILGKHDTKAACKLIERDYPWLKTTSKRLA